MAMVSASVHATYSTEATRIVAVYGVLTKLQEPTVGWPRVDSSRPVTKPVAVTM